MFVIFLVPIQTTSEELFFRGFLLQWIGKLVKQPILLSIIVGFIFGALHFGNPEMSNSALWVGLDYVFTGFMLSYITIRTNSAEFTIGAHAANNMFFCIFLTYENSVYGNLPSLLALTDVNSMLSTIYSIITYTLFFIIAVHYHKKNADKK
ncbi:CPBP family intramembrane glutamic endopeptidase [Parageobacillus toebii]|uniref:CPBP family intramembrane glutamic endopeptidase n=1 Tax=Parageobacillus toebii TaxID=153151 RepID=UPI003D2724B0